MNFSKQWGSAIRPFEIRKHLKSRSIWNPDFFKVKFSNGRALAMFIAIVPTIWKPDHSKTGCFCPDFKWFLTKWRPFIQISNGWASGFQIPFKIQTICNPTSFWPFKIQTSLDFRSPLYMKNMGHCLLILLQYFTLLYEHFVSELGGAFSNRSKTLKSSFTSPAGASTLKSTLSEEKTIQVKSCRVLFKTYFVIL